MTKNRIPAAGRRGILRAVLGAVLAAAVATPAFAQTAEAPKELRIGYQKYGTLVILKARGTLEKRLADKCVAVK